MDYEVPIKKLTNKAEDLSQFSTTTDSQVDTIKGQLDNYSGTEISAIISSINTDLGRLKTGGSEIHGWLNDYTTSLEGLESELSASSSSEIEPFQASFDNIFLAITAPTLQGGSEERKANVVTDEHDLLGNVDEARIPDNGCSIRVPYYSQNEGEWSGLAFGGGNIGSSGCSISSLAMVLSYLKRDDINPGDVRQTISDNNNGNYNAYMVSAGASWTIFPAVADYYNVNCNQLSSESVAQALRNGHPVIMSAAPGDFTSSGHFIVLTGIDENGQITLNDPNGRHTSYSNRKWDLNYVLRQGKGWWEFTS